MATSARKNIDTDALESYIHSGKSISEAASEFGITNEAIHYHMRVGNIDRPNGTECPGCGDEFTALGNHFHASPNCRPPIEGELWETVTGLLLGDGGLGWNNGDSTPVIQIGCCSAHGREGFFTRIFEDVGFTPSITTNEIRFPKSETPDILDYIGEPPPDFGYKWEWRNRGDYKKKLTEVKNHPAP